KPRSSHLEQLLVVNHRTAVHDARDAGGGCTPPRRGVHHADLQPDQTGLHGDRLVHDRTRELAAPEHVYDIDGARRRRRGERRVAPLAEHGLVLGVHRYDAVAGLLEVSRHLMAGPPGLGRQAYDRDRRRFPQEGAQRLRVHASGRWMCGVPLTARPTSTDRKSTRLNSSHQIISYAVFCLKKKRPSWRSRSPAHEPDTRAPVIRCCVSTTPTVAPLCTHLSPSFFL